MVGQQATRPALLADDLKLVEDVLRKDRKATAEFVETYAGAVYAYLRRRLPPRQDLVEDLVQEVFLAAWRSLSQFRGSASLRVWLLGIARHKVEDFYRDRLRQPESYDEDAHRESDAELVMDGHMEGTELEQRVQAILAELPQPYSLVLLWRYWEKRSAREMAAQTGRTEKAIERLLARAREQFKKRWNDA